MTAFTIAAEHAIRHVLQRKKWELEIAEQHRDDLLTRLHKNTEDRTKLHREIAELENPVGPEGGTMGVAMTEDTAGIGGQVEAVINHGDGRVPQNASDERHERARLFGAKD